MQADKKKVLFIVTRAELGGAQNHINQLLQHFCQQYDCSLFVGSGGPLLDNLSECNVDIHIVPELDSKSFFPAFFKLRSIMRKIQPDLVHTHSAIASFIGRLAAKSLGVKTLYTVHGWHFTPNAVWKRKLFGWALELLARPFTDRWITVSEYDKQLGALRGVLNKKLTTVIPNGIANTETPRKKTTINSQNTPLKVAFIGRASYQKNCLAAVDIVQSCKHPTSLTLFCANGDHLPTLRQKINAGSTHETKTVSLVETEDQAGDRLHEFDVLLMTSLYEGMPLCALEAMRAGLPIVATKVCGMSEIIEHGKNGYLFPPSATGHAARALDKLNTEPKRRLEMGLISKEKFIASHTEKAMLSNVNSLYRNLIDD